MTEVTNMEHLLYHFKGIVTNVVSSNTIDITVDMGFDYTTTQRFRLIGIDAPDGVKCEQGLNYFTELMLGQEVYVKSIESDHEGSWLAVVYINEGDGNIINVNARLISEGFV